MDAKNVIAAISLSAAVIILYGLFFAPDPQIANQQKLLQEKNTANQTSEAPSIDQPKKVESLSRNDSIAESKRITFENENIKGTISLTGAIIDDLTFVKYTKTLNGSIFDMNTSDLYTWTSSHNNWSSLDINTKLKENGKIVKGNFFGNKIERLRFFKNLYIMFPTIIRPFLLFFYKYFILLGFLDGKVGFYYCFLNSLWFRTLIDAKKFEKKIKK